MSYGKVNSYEVDPPRALRVVPPNQAMAETAAGKVTASTKHKGKMRVFNILNDDERDEYETLLTKHINKDPTIMILSEQTSFGRDGEFLIALKWVEIKDK